MEKGRRLGGRTKRKSLSHKRDEGTLQVMSQPHEGRGVAHVKEHGIAWHRYVFPFCLYITPGESIKTSANSRDSLSRAKTTDVKEAHMPLQTLNFHRAAKAHAVTHGAPTLWRHADGSDEVANMAMHYRLPFPISLAVFYLPVHNDSHSSTRQTSYPLRQSYIITILKWRLSPHCCLSSRFPPRWVSSGIQ